MGGVVGGKLVAVVVDAYAIDSHGLTDSEWTSMMVVASRVRDDGDLILSASNQTLAKWLRCSTRTVRRRREKLTQVGFLTLIARGDGRGHASVYQINPHSLEGDRALSTFKGSQRGTTQAVKGDNSGRKGGHPAWPTRNKELRNGVPRRAEPYRGSLGRSRNRRRRNRHRQAPRRPQRRRSTLPRPRHEHPQPKEPDNDHQRNRNNRL